jgi:hypothetical protein
MKVGDKVKFYGEKQAYTVQACNERFAVCTKPFNPKRTVLYTIIDFQKMFRGTENLVFGFGFETRKACEEALERLSGKSATCFQTEVSHRNRVPLGIEKVTPQVSRCRCGHRESWHAAERCTGRHCKCVKLQKRRKSL